MVVSREHGEFDRKAALLRRVGIGRGLSFELGQLVSAHEHAKGRHALEKDAHRTQRFDLVCIEAELLVEIIECNRGEIENAADRNAAATGGMARG